MLIFLYNKRLMIANITPVCYSAKYEEFPSEIGYFRDHSRACICL